jgi:hypothetical protein
LLQIGNQEPDAGPQVNNKDCKEYNGQNPDESWAYVHIINDFLDQLALLDDSQNLNHSEYSYQSI